MTRESLREQLIASGAIRPAGTGKPILRVNGATITEACADILAVEGADVARAVVANPSADPRVRLLLSRLLERRAAA